MADKQVTVAEPEERVPESYAWFAAFLAPNRKPMSDDPVFVYAAVYADREDADADYDTLLDLHSADLVGSYDV
ncbi:MAG: hypothetical protein WBP81_26140, partial [Solirubrobacteraceae bacterium]